MYNWIPIANTIGTDIKRMNVKHSSPEHFPFKKSIRHNTEKKAATQPRQRSSVPIRRPKKSLTLFVVTMPIPMRPDDVSCFDDGFVESVVGISRISENVEDCFNFVFIEYPKKVECIFR